MSETESESVVVFKAPLHLDDNAAAAEVVPEKVVPEPSAALAPLLNYLEPDWACEPPASAEYRIDVLKGGIVVERIPLTPKTTFVLVGRLPQCDIPLEHPSLSRHHAILQYGDGAAGCGWYAYDLASTHGSKLNKRQLPPKQYERLRVGHVLQFGGSTRLLTLEGPTSDQESEWDCSPTEMRERKHRKQLERKLAAQAKREMMEEEAREEAEKKRAAAAQAGADGCSWGFDFAESSGLIQQEGDEHLLEDSDAFYRDDPRKALSRFFEREGFDMVIDYSESGQGSGHKWTASIELPVEQNGRSLIASATVGTSKREAAIEVCLEACRVLDKHGLLRNAGQKRTRAKKRLVEDDYYEDDEDAFYDRTGHVEAARERRKQREEGEQLERRVEKDTYETLQTKLGVAKKDVTKIQAQLDELANSKVTEAKVVTGADELDAYVQQLAKNQIGADSQKTRVDKMLLREKLVKAVHEVQRLERLVLIAKPAGLPNVAETKPTDSKSTAFLKKLAKLGKVGLAPTSTAAASLPNSDDQPPSKIVKTEEGVDEKAEKEKEDMKTKLREKQEMEAAIRSATGDIDEAEEKDEKPTRSEEPAVSEAHMEEENDDNDDDDDDDEPLLDDDDAVRGNPQQSRRRRARAPRNRDKKPAAASPVHEGTYGDGCADKDLNYATWMPPDEQRGDGRTALHDKFGDRY